jgi:intracellular septation protein A
MAASTGGEVDSVEPIAVTPGKINGELTQTILDLQSIVLKLQNAAEESLLQGAAIALQQHASRLKELIDPVRFVLRPERFYQAGMVAKADERFEIAARLFRRALELRPEYPEAHKGLGDALRELGRFAEAEACCRETLRLIPNYVDAHNTLGIVLLSLGKPEKAEIHFREALRLKPGNAVFLHNLFITLKLEQRIGEVAAWLGRSITLKSDFLSAIFFLLAYVTFGNVRLAGVCLIAARLAQLGGIKLTGRRIHQMQWMRFALVLVLGGATVLTQNPDFIMVQPSALHFAVAGLMLWRGGMVLYITSAARQRVPETVTVAAGYAWAALMAALGLTNLMIVLYFNLTTWAWFIVVGAIGAKTLEYVMFRMIVRHRIVQCPWITLGGTLLETRAKNIAQIWV